MPDHASVQPDRRRRCVTRHYRDNQLVRVHRQRTRPEAIR